MVKKYPIGTKIRYCPSPTACLSAQEDRNMVGEIVSIDTSVGIYLPESVHQKDSYYHGKLLTWFTSWDSIKLALPQKGEQLEFDFMKE